MAEQSPDPWRVVWRVVTSNEVLVALLLTIAVSLTLTAWIPQRPSSDADYARWLSEIQGRFGKATPLLRGLGGFRIVSSFGFRVLLAMLAACLLLRLVEGLDGFIEHEDVHEPPGEWKPISDYDWTELLQELQGRRYRVANASSFFQVDGWPWSVVLPLVAHVGAFILLVSLFLSHSLGWQVEDIALQGGERRSLPGGTGWVMLSENGDAVRTGGSPDVVSFIEDEGPGVRVSAIGADGEPLSLILTPNAEPSSELRIALSEDGYFAVPAAELVARLTPRSEEPYSRVDVQVYSSPTGEIIAELVTERGGDGQFDVAGVTLTSVPAPYARLTITHNPGRLPAGLGLIFLIVGIIGSLMCPDRRFWLRQEEELVEVTGPVPAWLYDGGEEG